MNLIVADDLEALVELAAKRIADRITGAGGRAAICATGGSTPRPCTGSACTGTSEIKKHTKAASRVERRGAYLMRSHRLAPGASSKRAGVATKGVSLE